jgi:beta-galactosidase
MVKEGMQQALETFVKNGGILVTGFMSGIVDQSDNVYLGGYPGPLRKLSGIWVEEIDALPPERCNTIRFADGKEAACRLLCEIIHSEGAETLAEFSSDFYAGHMAVTRNNYGEGSVFYIGTELVSSAMDKVLGMVTEAAQIRSLTAEPTSLEIACRESDERKLWFIMNFTDEVLPLPTEFAGKTDLLSGCELICGTMLKKYETYLVCND